MRLNPPHDHTDAHRLTIGCPGCIELVRLDQIVAVFIECWDEGVLPERPPTPSRWRCVYARLRCEGYEWHEVKGVMLLWAQEHDWGPAASAKAEGNLPNGGLLSI